MMTCDLVAERIALGESLGELAEHAATCDRCNATGALTARLAGVHREVDPGMGFAARMTAGAQHRIVVRRRRRLAGVVAASTLAASLGVFVMTRHDDPVVAPPATATGQDPPADPSEIAADTAMLLRDPDRTAKRSADWGRIEKPIRPYKHVLKGLLP
jgi:hypothetical protein